MNREAEIEAIRNRHAVRQYENRKIEPEILARLQTRIVELNEAGGLHLQLLEDAGDTFNRLLNRAMGLGSAPSVIACVGTEGDSLEERVGYYGEQLVLFAQQLGLNTCWAGTFNRKKIPASVSEGERLVIAIAVGYGVNSGKPHKSKSESQVTGGDTEKPEWFKSGVELALLAPTAINQQKFEILYQDGQAVIQDKGGILSKIDLGIVRYHFEVGAGEHGKTGSFSG